MDYISARTIVLDCLGCYNESRIFKKESRRKKKAGEQETGIEMSIENGEWIMHGMAWDDPYRIRAWQELINWINEIGFLPLFGNGVTGFSAEEHTSPDYWWSGIRGM